MSAESILNQVMAKLAAYPATASRVRRNYYDDAATESELRTGLIEVDMPEDEETEMRVDGPGGLAHIIHVFEARLIIRIAGTPATARAEALRMADDFKEALYTERGDLGHPYVRYNSLRFEKTRIIRPGANQQTSLNQRTAFVRFRCEEQRMSNARS